MEQLKKEIEADPYNFLFGRSNEWLRYRDSHARDWSAWCRSFLGLDRASKNAQVIDTNPSPKVKETSFPETTKSDNVIESSKYQEPTAASESPAKATIDTVYDPVSGRMVPRISQSPEAEKDAAPKGDDAADIPVKTFKSYRAQFGYGTDTNEGTQKLAQEDGPANSKGQEPSEQARNSTPEATEGMKQENQKPDVLYMAGPEKVIDVPPSSAVSQGLEASVQADGKPSSDTIKEAATSPEAQRKVYNFEENKDDDIDLLRASDIRASLYSGKTKQEIAEEKKSKREALERDFNSYKDPESDLDVEEIRASAKKHESLQVPGSQAEEVPSSTAPALKDHETSATQIDEQSSPEARGSESVSLKAQADHDSISLQSPTSVSSDKESSQSHKSSLSQEIKDIYESAYGEITPQHRQGSLTEKVSPSNSDVVERQFIIPEPQTSQTSDVRLQETFQSAKKFTETTSEITKELAETCRQLEASKSAPDSRSPQPDQNPSSNALPALPATYRVLAYDSSTLQVVIAETTSSVYSAEQTLHPTEVLSRLNSPAKFLPHFAQIQADGFEIVSGGGDILVFKKVRDPRASSMAAGLEEPAAAKINSESRSEEQQGIPSGVDRDQIITQSESVRASSPSSPPPPPPEVDSTGREKSSFGKTARWVLLTGVGTAATCYAIGVVCEYFRTGGTDGLGPEGFTEFEAERRRREKASS